MTDAQAYEAIIKPKTGCFKIGCLTLILIFVVMPITCTIIGKATTTTFDPLLVEIQGDVVYYDGKHLMTPDDIVERKPTGKFLALCRTVGNFVAVKKPAKDSDIAVVMYPIEGGYMVEWIDFSSRQIYDRADVGKIHGNFLHNQIDLRQSDD